MKTKDFLKQHSACIDGAKWALSVSDDIADVWDAMIEQGKHDWLLWTATRLDVFPDSVLRKLACRFVRETPLSDGRKVWDLLTDERSRKAVEVAELYADGKATHEELEAARAAARDARDAAPVAADAAAFAAYAVYAAVRDAARVAAYAAYAAACAAVHAAYAAADVRAAAYDAYDAYTAAADAADDAADAAKAAQTQMLAELGNPFK